MGSNPTSPRYFCKQQPLVCYSLAFSLMDLLVNKLTALPPNIILYLIRKVLYPYKVNGNMNRIILTLSLSLFLLGLKICDKIPLGLKYSDNVLVLCYEKSKDLTTFIAGLKEGISNRDRSDWVNLNIYNLPNQTLTADLQKESIGYLLGYYDLILKLKTCQLLDKQEILQKGWIRVKLLPKRVSLYKGRKGYLVNSVSFQVKLYFSSYEKPSPLLKETLSNTEKRLTKWANQSPIFRSLKILIAGIAIGKVIRRDPNLHKFSYQIKSILIPKLPINLEPLFLTTYSHFYFQRALSYISGGIPRLTPKEIEISPNFDHNFPKKEITLPAIITEQGPLHQTPATCPICGSKHLINLFSYHPIIYHPIIKNLSAQEISEHYSPEFQNKIVPGVGYKADFLYSAVQCKNCNHIFVKELPPEETDKSLEENFQILQKQGGLKAKTERKLNHAQKQLKPIFENLPKGKVVLDIGAGLGMHLLALRKGGYNAFGIEISPLFSQWCNNVIGVPVFTQKLEKLNLPSNSVDAITIFTVLEHVKDPLSLLKEAERILKPGGILLISELPNLLSYIARAERENYHDLKVGHIHFFTPQSIKTLLQEAGLEIEEFIAQVNLKDKENEMKNGLLSPQDYEFIVETHEKLNSILNEELGDLITVVAYKPISNKDWGLKTDKTLTYSPTYTIATLEEIFSLAENRTDKIFQLLPDEIKENISQKEFAQITKELFCNINTKEEFFTAVISLLYSLNLTGTKIFKETIEYIAQKGYSDLSPSTIAEAENSGQKILNTIQSNLHLKDKGGIELSNTL